ncbi:MAG: glycosyltransferase family 4 protein [Candidatus Brocadiaceae bacterium]|nr:glycosyltransferase family 4 protein [Candidatus Brocadiaceae bacterium]
MTEGINLHICVITESYISEQTYAGHRVYDYVNTLVKKGVKVSVVTLQSIGQPSEEFSGNLDVYRLYCGNSKIYFPSFFAKALHKVRQIHKKEKIDLLYAFWAGIAGFTGTVASQLLRVPAVVSVRGSDVNYSQEFKEGAFTSWKVRLLVRYTLRYATAIESVSQNLKDRIEDFWKIRRNNIAVIYPFVSDKFLQNEHINLHPNTSDESMRLLTVCGLRKIKRVSDALEACKLLKLKGLPFKYIVVGGDMGNLKELQSLAEKLDIQANVAFWGYIERERVLELYDQCDIFIMPSIMEGCNGSCLEAMARRKPVILTSATGTIEVVKHMESGVVVPPYAPEAIASHIEILWKDKALRTRIGKSAYQSVKEKHNSDVWANKFLEFISDLI